MELSDFNSAESLLEKFKADYPSQILGKISLYLENLNPYGLAYLINKLTQKWPTIKTKNILIAGLRRIIQTKFYKDIYKTEPSKNIIKRDKQLIENLNLSEEKPNWIDNPELDIKPIKIKKIKISTEKTIKPIKTENTYIPITSLEELIKLALELGVEQIKIDKHKDKSIGLAKMNIGNLIRNKQKLMC